jgi:serine palmitoyltransferase
METLASIQHTLMAIPGSSAVVRYIKASHQNDPFRTVLELILVVFAIRTLLMGRTRSDRAGKNFVKLAPKVSP